MDKNRLLILASESKMLRNLAAKLCNYRDIHNDLFSEFLLFLCEKDEEFIINKYNNAQFIAYCSNCIKGLNSHRLRSKTLINTKCSLSEKHNDFEIIDFDIMDDCYNFEIEEKVEQIKKITSNDKFKSEILFKSVVKSTREIAQEFGLNQRKLIYENNKFKTEIKNKFNEGIRK